MTETILVTGGAGFIGSHLVDALVARGDYVRVFDNMEPRVHGPLSRQWQRPDYSNVGAQYILGDVRDRAPLARALQDVEVVYHLAAATGVGQSMYQIGKYVEVNVQGTANLLDILANGAHRLRKLILSSSRAVYGEGAYHCERCGIVHPPVRSPAQLDEKRWEVACPRCGAAVTPVPTPESLAPDPGSVYAVTERAQEQLCLTFGRAYGVAVTVLRFFNVYGPRQSLPNPYTGIITAFLNRLARGQAPEIYEDGRMTRDFVHVSDVVEACRLALESDATADHIINVGSGGATSILELAQLLCGSLAPDIEPQICGGARVGDVRHCSADWSAARQLLGYTPHTSLEVGLRGLDGATANGQIADDRLALARGELKRAGLLR